MKNLSLPNSLLLASIGILLVSHPQLRAEALPDGSAKKSHEAIEWCDIWQPHENQSGLPRVLLIGDSITRGYYPAVEKQLKGKALVDRLTSSAFTSDPMLTAQIIMMLDNEHYDVIHFNNGMHGWQHSEDEYRAAYPAFVETIRKHAPSAKLICATTTPLKISTPVKPGDPHSSDERIQARNTIAIEIVKPLAIAVDDLYTPMKAHPELHKDNVHFNTQGTDLQGQQVAAEISKLLTK